METITTRFPHLGELIFDHLDDQSFAKCKTVSKTWSIYIGEQTFHAIRIIRKKGTCKATWARPIFTVFKPCKATWA